MSNRDPSNIVRTSAAHDSQRLRCKTQLDLRWSGAQFLLDLLLKILRLCHIADYARAWTWTETNDQPVAATYSYI